MKRPPNPGELALAHTTEQTGDVQTFAVSRDNYDPAILAKMAGMEREPVMGYQLYVDRSGLGTEFRVLREDGTALTRNRVSMHDLQISLSTSILHPMPADESAMLADLEQCAALVLLGVRL